MTNYTVHSTSHHLKVMQFSVIAYSSLKTLLFVFVTLHLYRHTAKHAFSLWFPFLAQEQIYPEPSSAALCPLHCLFRTLSVLPAYFSTWTTVSGLLMEKHLYVGNRDKPSLFAHFLRCLGSLTLQSTEAMFVPNLSLVFILDLVCRSCSNR